MTHELIVQYSVRCVDLCKQHALTASQPARRGHVFHTFSYSYGKYFVAMMIMITPCACALHGASVQRMRIKYFIFATTQYSVLTLLLAINVMFAYGAVPPKVIGLRRGHPGEQHIILLLLYFQI